MKTNRKTIRKPELFVDDHHGIYVGKIAYESLNDRYKKQAAKILCKEGIEAIQNINDERYCEAVDTLTQIDFKTETGQKFNLQFTDGGLWVIPLCFYRSKEADNFFQ